MSFKKKRYWQGLEDLNNDDDFIKSLKTEFSEELPIERIFNKNKVNCKSSRRDFLKTIALGSVSFVAAACTRTPVKKAVPYLVKPEEITPGVSTWYASTCGSCESKCSILIKTREGRPIKIEGNKLSKLSKGGVCAKGQASLLNLYDDNQLKQSVEKGKYTYLDEMDPKVRSALKQVSEKKGAIRLVTSTISSPSTKKLINELIQKYPTIKHVTYDSFSHYALVKANKISFNKAVIPNYYFDHADLIVSFEADFLGNWISPTRFIRSYTQKRNVKYIDQYKKMSRHIQFESRLSITGSNADLRVPLKPSERGLALLYLYNLLAKKASKKILTSIPVLRKDLKTHLEKTAEELWANQSGKSIVASGSNNLQTQILVNAINFLLKNYNKSIDLNQFSNQRQGSDKEMLTLAKEIKEGKIKAIIFYNVNPVYNFPGFPYSDLRDKVELKIAFSRDYDETTYLCDYTYANKHFLESWNDDEPIKGYYHFSQPSFDMNKIKGFELSQAQEIWLGWLNNDSKKNKQSYYDYIKNYWKEKLKVAHKSWDEIVHDGVFENNINKNSSELIFKGNLNEAKDKLLNDYYKAKNSEFELILYESPHMGDGRHANNPWLQELPDPISKVCWDNYISVSPKMAKEKGWKQGDILKIKINKKQIKLPVLLQPGQLYKTLSIALGYGRVKVGQIGIDVGRNAFPFIEISNDQTLLYDITTNVEVIKTLEKYHLAQTQTYHSIRDPFLKKPRPIIQETTLDEFKKGNMGSHAHPMELINLWPERPERTNSNHSWGLAIDLNSCIGCSGCIISCQSENNIPVVGKKEIINKRDLQWVRMDRYYEGDEENPSVMHQPMMCQHCDNAPCETVCPVLATVHTHDGLNHQAYNRCVGTRYCANNCPYKVRRFNWFQYSNNDKFDFNMNSSLSRLQLNPDVTVRSRGVMEKCSMCIQRIQEAKLKAKVEKRKLKDGDVKLACQQSCPGDAIVFGDLNDKNSNISKLFKNKRKFFVLEEYKTLPSIAYLTQIRNN